RRLAALGVDLADLEHDPRPEPVAERDRMVAALATALTLVVVVYDSAAVVLGGGILRATGWLRPRVEEELRRRAAHSPFLAGLAVADRLAELPADLPVAAIGAAVV